MFTLSIVIATRDRSTDLQRLLFSLYNQEYSPLDIVVVDDSKSLFTREMVKSLVSKFNLANYNLKYIKGSKDGLASARNLGTRNCEGDFVLFLDDDTEVGSSSLSELVTAMALDSSIGAAQAKLLQMEKRDTLDCAGVILNVVGFGDYDGFGEKDKGQYDSRQRISYAKGGSIIVRRDVWARLEGYDPLFFFHFEEADFCWRAWLSGYQVAFVPSAKIFHKGGATKSILRDNIHRNNSEFLLFRNRIIMVAKNLEFKNLIKYTPWLFAMYLYWIMLSIRRSQWASVLGILRGTIWCLRFFNLIWSRRLTVQRTRVSSDEDLFKYGAIFKTIFI